MSNGSTQQPASDGLAAILTSLQQGVVGLNNLTQTMKSIFPSS